MNKIICLMGKSCTGKDTIYKRLLSDAELKLKVLVPYTTRPIRINEHPGVEYNFVSEEDYDRYKRDGMILEERSYDTVHGVWRYFTVRDDKILNSGDDYLYIGTLQAYDQLCLALGKDNIIPVYIEVDDSVRIDRAVKREHKQAEPKYAEMCRRFLSDTEDFSEENLAASGITVRFKNDDLDDCLLRIREYIRTHV